jgi:hypothetical protein
MELFHNAADCSILREPKMTAKNRTTINMTDAEYDDLSALVERFQVLMSWLLCFRRNGREIQTCRSTHHAV